jgi:hypothetical protein
MLTLILEVCRMTNAPLSKKIILFLIDKSDGDVFGGCYGEDVVMSAQLMSRGVKVDVVNVKEVGATEDSDFGIFAISADKEKCCNQQV